jgi:hypothetical protein
MDSSLVHFWRPKSINKLNSRSFALSLSLYEYVSNRSFFSIFRLNRSAPRVYVWRAGATVVNYFIFCLSRFWIKIKERKIIDHPMCILFFVSTSFSIFTNLVLFHCKKLTWNNKPFKKVYQFYKRFYILFLRILFSKNLPYTLSVHKPSKGYVIRCTFINALGYMTDNISLKSRLIS